MIGDGTPVAMSFVVVLMTVMCGLVWRAASTLTDMQNELKSQSTAIAELKGTMWTKQEHETWALRLANQNPTMKVPETRKKDHYE